MTPQTLIVTSETSAQEVAEFLANRAIPLEVAGSKVYDFNNNPFDPERFEKSGLPTGTYIIPFSMSDIWGDIIQLLPPKIAALPRLRFNPRAESGGYTISRSLIPVDPPIERQLRAELAQHF